MALLIAKKLNTPTTPIATPTEAPRPGRRSLRLAASQARIEPPARTAETTPAGMSFQLHPDRASWGR
jgi:hypothetical protein